MELSACWSRDVDHVKTGIGREQRASWDRRSKGVHGTGEAPEGGPCTHQEAGQCEGERGEVGRGRAET